MRWRTPTGKKYKGVVDLTTRSCQTYVHVVSLGTRSGPDWGWDAMGVFLDLEMTGRARAVTT